MFAKSIIESDAFLDMPPTARLLYYDLCMRADDDGFVNAPKNIMRSIGASQDDLTLLLMKNFLIPFDSGVVAVRHWRVHNYIRHDRYKATSCVNEKNRLHLNESGIYEFIGNAPEIPGNPPVEQPAQRGQPRLGKDRSGKVSLGKGREEAEAPETPAPALTLGEYRNVYLTKEEYEKLKAEFPDSCDAKIDRLSEYMRQSGKSYSDHYATVRAWAKEDAGKSRTESGKNGCDNGQNSSNNVRNSGNNGQNNSNNAKNGCNTGRNGCNYARNRHDNTSATPSSFETDEFFLTALQRSYGGEVP